MQPKPRKLVEFRKDASRKDGKITYFPCLSCLHKMAVFGIEKREDICVIDPGTKEWRTSFFRGLQYKKCLGCLVDKDKSCFSLPWELHSGFDELAIHIQTVHGTNEAESLENAQKLHDEDIADYNAEMKEYMAQQGDPKYVSGDTELQEGEERMIDRPVAVEPFDEDKVRKEYHDGVEHAKEMGKECAERIMAEFNPGNRGWWEIAQAHSGAIEVHDKHSESGVLLQGRSRSKRANKRRADQEAAGAEGSDDGLDGPVTPRKKQILEGDPRGVELPGYDREGAERSAQQQSQARAAALARESPETPDSPDNDLELSGSIGSIPAQSPTPAGRKRRAVDPPAAQHKKGKKSKPLGSAGVLAVVNTDHGPINFSENAMVAYYNKVFGTKNRSKGGIYTTPQGKMQWAAVYPPGWDEDRE